MKTVVLGIGNPVLGDDGVGVYVAQELARKISDKNIAVKDVSFDGLNLLEHILGYDRLIVIDAMTTEEGEAGRIYRLKPEELDKPSYTTVSPHHFNLAATLEIGRKLFPGEMPQEVTVFAVTVQDIATFSEEMTEKVKAAVPKVLRLVTEELGLPNQPCRI